MRFIGSHTFTPEDVISIAPYGAIPVFARGVKVTHVRSDCPSHVVFWCLGSPAAVIRGVHDAGFKPAAPPAAVVVPRGMPLRMSALIVTAFVWNALLGLDWLTQSRWPPIPGPLSLIALALRFGVSMWLPRSESLRGFVLRPDRSFGEIRSFVLLLQVVSGLMLAAIAAMLSCPADLSRSHLA